METAYLLKNARNATRLRESIAQVKQSLLPNQTAPSECLSDAESSHHSDTHKSVPSQA